MIKAHATLTPEQAMELRLIDEKYWSLHWDREAREEPRNVLDRRKWLRETSIRRAEYALTLDGDDAKAAECFGLAAHFALLVIRTTQAPSPLKVGAAQADYSPTSGIEYSVAPVREVGLGGVARMSIVDYNDALSTLWSFGAEEALVEASRVPEREYRSAGIVMSEAGFKSFEVEKRLARREETAALALIDEIFDSLEPAMQLRLTVVRAVAAGDVGRFEGGLDRYLRMHKKRAAKEPGNLEGLISHTGMMLCRLALRRGIRIPDQAYLPLRFAPWYAAVH